MSDLNVAAEQQYLAAERDTELRDLMDDPAYFLVPCDRHNDIVPNCSGCQAANGIRRKGAHA